MPPLKGFMLAWITILVLGIIIVAGIIVTSRHVEIHHPYLAEGLNWGLAFGIAFLADCIERNGEG